MHIRLPGKPVQTGVDREVLDLLKEEEIEGRPDACVFRGNEVAKGMTSGCHHFT